MDSLSPRGVRALLCCALLAGTTVACQAQQPSALENAFPSLSFDEPTELTFAPDGSNRLYIGEKDGLIRVFENDRATTVISTFLDIRAISQNSGERGFLGFAMHPDYAANGHVYVHYSANDGRTTLARYTRSALDPLVADPASAQILLQVNDFASNHNGGKLAFGPDGYLYLSLGDGGGGGDPMNYGQNKAVLLGKLLRLDVDNPESPLNYGIPPDNPFAGNTEGFREEIFAYGLRNMWKFSFDRETDVLWGADVGQGVWEEINLIENGGNYGWKQVEGPACYVAGCDLSLYDAPIFWYNHNSGECSVTGGTVYRGVRNPELTGTYVYSDYCSGTVWGLTYEDSTAVNRTLVEAGFGVIAFGEDQAGELYVLEQSTGPGAVRRFVPTGGVAAEGSAPGLGSLPTLRLAGPNPFAGQTRLIFALPAAGRARLAVFDVLGREVARLFEGTVAAGVERAVAVDAARWAPGTYVVRLDTPTGTVQRRVVVAG